MIIRGLHGQLLPALPGDAPCRVIAAASAPPGAAVARVVGWRERLDALAPIVVDRAGRLLGGLSIMVAHTNPAIAQSADAAVVDGVRARLVITGEQIALGAGSIVGPDGPVDRLWVVGQVGGRTIVSDVVMTGLTMSHAAWSPVFVLDTP